MFYEFSVAVPARKTEADPTEKYLQVCRGIIHRIEIQFPIGTRALAHCQLRHHSFAQLPTNPDGNFASDGYVIPIDENLEFYSEPYIIKGVFWNDDDTYPHTITIRIGILDSKAAILMLSVLKGMAKFLKLVGVKV